MLFIIYRNNTSRLFCEILEPRKHINKFTWFFYLIKFCLFWVFLWCLFIWHLFIFLLPNSVSCLILYHLILRSINAVLQGLKKQEMALVLKSITILNSQGIKQTWINEQKSFLVYLVLSNEHMKIYSVRALGTHRTRWVHPPYRIFARPQLKKYIILC